MNWFAGNIAEAVNLSKSRGSIFVVFVEGLCFCHDLHVSAN